MQNPPKSKRCWKCSLSKFLSRAGGYLSEVVSREGLLRTKRSRYFMAAVLDGVFILIILVNAFFMAQKYLGPLVSPLHPLRAGKSGYEVFGFAPYWTFDKLNNVNFNVLTTFAYFGVTVNDDGTLEKDDQGYQTFESRHATDIFTKAHNSGTRVVLTLTQMDNQTIRDIMDSPEAQQEAISEAVDAVQSRGIDGINLDFEYQGDPGQAYRDKFSRFVSDLSNSMHAANPNSKVTVSVYASALKDPKIYDIGSISKASDGIFMMAYDFAVAGSDNAIPTDPLYGYKDGKYWYDISSAVGDFLKVMPANKLILGVPYYGYNYSVESPTVKAVTGWGNGSAEMYGFVQDNINPGLLSSNEDIDQYKTGWDSEGQVGWKAYHIAGTDEWRMVFIDDPKSLQIKYDFAKSKNLAGVGIWALGFDSGRPELWSLLSSEFGDKYADASVVGKAIMTAYAGGGGDN